VLSLFAVEGLSHQDIAGILGIPEGAVWTRLQAARRMVVEPVGR
jgi:RNA polymerase sigma-70 factor (ECF subfamily)